MSMNSMLWRYSLELKASTEGWMARPRRVEGARQGVLRFSRSLVSWVREQQGQDVVHRAAAGGW
jgi:hypothetical protein